MRVLFTSPEHAHLHVGGLAYSAARISDGLAAMSHAVTVVVFDRGGPYREGVRPPLEAATLARGGVTLELVPRIDLLTAVLPETLRTPARRLESAYLRLKGLVAEHRPDVIVSLFPSTVGYPSALVAREQGIPLVLGFRGNDAGRHFHDSQRIPYLLHCLRTARAATFVARDLESLVRAAAPALPRTMIIPNGIEPELLRRPWRPIARQAPVFGAVGFFQPKKNIELFLRVAAEESGLRGRVRLVGAFVKSATDPRSFGVELTGALPRDRALTELERIDVFVAPSFSDGCPNAVLEAAAAGRAILCSRVGAMADLLVHGESAYFLRDWTLASMRAALDDLDRDGHLRVRIAAGARRVAESLTVEREINAWERLLRRACAAG